MPWYWVLILISVIVGPFEAMHAYNQAKKRSQERKRKEMETKYYVVIRLDGDYAWLRRTDVQEAEDINVARALLPEEIDEGTRLKYEMLQYEVI